MLRLLFRITEVRVICSPDPVRIRLGVSGRSTPQKSISLLSSVLAVGGDLLGAVSRCIDLHRVIRKKHDDGYYFLVT